MICQTLHPKSAWTCATNMFWDTNRAIMCTTRAGEKLKSVCAPRKAFRRSLPTPRPDTTPRPINSYRLFPTFALLFFLVFFSLTAQLLRAQIPVNEPPPPPPPGLDASKSQSGSKIQVDVNLVVLHTTVLDDRGKFVEGLGQDNFRVFEDKAEQKLSVFKREDIPVSMGL